MRTKILRKILFTKFHVLPVWFVDQRKKGKCNHPILCSQHCKPFDSTFTLSWGPWMIWLQTTCSYFLPCSPFFLFFRLKSIPVDSETSWTNSTCQKDYFSWESHDLLFPFILISTSKSWDQGGLPCSSSKRASPVILYLLNFFFFPEHLLYTGALCLCLSAFFSAI